MGGGFCPCLGYGCFTTLTSIKILPGNHPLWLYININLPSQAEADTGVFTAGAISAAAMGDGCSKI